MRILLLGVIFLLLSLGAFAAEGASNDKFLGSSLEDAAFFDLNGTRHRMSEVKSEYVVVVFWAFWCDTWEKALPHIKELAGKREELDFEIWTVSIDGQRTEEIRPLYEKKQIPFPVLLDEGDYSERLGVTKVPTVLILDKSRKVIYCREVYPGNHSIENALRGIK